jgi:hypothetical protein
MEADLAAGAVADVNAHAAVPATSASKNQKLQKSDNLLWLLADIIHANLCTMHMVLSPPNTRGKGDAVEDLIKFLSAHQHDLLRGKSTTSETLNKWITECKKLADAEQARRDEI